MKTKSYRVTGGRRVFGHERGETFSLPLDPAHEAALIAAGHITVAVEDKGAGASTTTTKKEEEHG